MRMILSCALVLLSLTAAANEYGFARYGSAQLNVSHEYVKESRLTAPTSVVGLGYRWDTWAVEAAFHDFGTYRFDGAKPVGGSATIHIGPIAIPLEASIDVPGYIEARAYGAGLGAKWNGPAGLSLKLEAVRVTAEAELHTPIGYRMERRSGWLPLAEAGLKYKRLVFGYAVAPKLRAATIGVEINL